MHDTLPLKLYLDISKVVPRQPGAVRWMVWNRADEDIVSLQIVLHPQNPEMVKAVDFKREHPHIRPNTVAQCLQSLEISKNGEFPFEVRISGRLSGGRRFELLVDPSPSFEIVKRGSGGTLELKLGKTCLAKNLDFGGFKNVKIETETDGEAIIDGKTFGGRLDAVNEVHARQLLPEDLAGQRELPLRLLPPEGLCPLDLARFAKAWPGNQGDLQLCFVNQKGEERGATTELLFPYRLRVKVSRTGYLTLLARDADGKYYILAPNALAPQASLLTAHQAVSLPGELLPIPKASGAEDLAFNAIGEEAVVALLTTRPLHAPEDPLKEWSEKQIADILGYVCNNQSDASLAFVRIRVEPVRYKS